MSSIPGSTNFVITDKEVIVPFEIAPGVNADRKIPIEDFFFNLSSQAALDTEIMPVSGTGLLALRQLGKYRQIVFQIDTGITTVVWGTHERDSNAKSYRVASPYRVIIADIFDGDLLGARMFYSPVPITSPTDVLYNINLPNVNCRGYGSNNAVGWLCLYLRESWKDLTIVQQILAINERAGGGEAYNDNNMDETDGARYYEEYRENHPEFYNPKLWQKKTSADGINWVNDPELLLPVYVASENKQDKNYAEQNEYGQYVPLENPTHRHPESGEWVYEQAKHLTIDMAMRGSYSAYYTDDQYVKPINNLTNPESDTDETVNYRSIIERSIVMSAPYGIAARTRPVVKQHDQWSFGSKWVAGQIVKKTKQTKEKLEKINFAPKKVGTCAFSKETIYEGADYIIVKKFGYVLKHVYENNLDQFVEIDYFPVSYNSTNGIYHENSIVYFTIEDSNSAYDGKVLPILDQHSNTLECLNCKTSYLTNSVIIKSLGLQEFAFIANESNFNAYCTNCSDLAECDYTGSFVPKQDLIDIEAFDPIQNKYVVYSISKFALVHLNKCLCDILIDNTTAYADISDLGIVCKTCINIAEDGSVSHVPVNKK